MQERPKDAELLLETRENGWTERDYILPSGDRWLEWEMPDRDAKKLEESLIALGFKDLQDLVHAIASGEAVRLKKKDD